MAHKFVRLVKKGEESLNKKSKKVYLYRYNFSSQKLEKARQVIWGDYLRIDENHDTSHLDSKWIPVVWSPRFNPETLYIDESYTSKERPLEIIFLDVGQGDGAILISPEQSSEEKIFVIDAGESENMYTFLKARFNPYRSFKFEGAIITHPDRDHYLGFENIFKDHRFGFKNIYQNGLVERPVSGKFEKVGGFKTDPDNGKDYIYDLAESKHDIEKHFSDDTNFGRYEFPPIMFNALNNPLIENFAILSTHPKHSTHENGRAFMPGFAPSNNLPYQIEILGPIIEEKNGKLRLRKISNQYGKTKNGHSILLRLHFGKFKVFFGGDLNSIAEKFLLKHYTNRTRFPQKGSLKSKEMIEEAKNWFEADIMKTCHHGATDVTDEFLSAVNPACFVISSGDEEGHIHPRPDLLGRLGKFGKGESPVILSTELQRSTREFEDETKVKKVLKKLKTMTNESNKAKRTEIKEKIERDIHDLTKLNVETYGAIYLKTDGQRLITAFKIEEKSDKKKWFYFEYLIDDDGKLKLKHVSG
ncbi:hypothetical protein ATO12_09960 [Aquimarina atlantica]|uniref:Metallo-beta-lactamase domain-containing protein n=1 Tax=Aquimarina atlantica TaxID=1317122 RepID=A0A023BYA1_9FLAO|nr:hypothetical protein [Aquimarina atlantica]EZH75042.1 hypothetical protein ATO12_09960 [Aquimarina atlantica]